MAKHTELLLRANLHVQTLAEVLIERARQQFGPLAGETQATAAERDRLVDDLASAALLQAYVSLQGELLAPRSDREIAQIIDARKELMAAGIKVFIQEQRGR